MNRSEIEQYVVSSYHTLDDRWMQWHLGGRVRCSDKLKIGLRGRGMGGEEYIQSSNPTKFTNINDIKASQQNKSNN